MTFYVASFKLEVFISLNTYIFYLWDMGETEISLIPNKWLNYIHRKGADLKSK